MDTFEIQQIIKLLPHRYPFLLVDRVTECEPNSHCKALKNVTMNEPFFPGHFPGIPVMPGVIILEALAQTAGILAVHTTKERPEDGHLYYFAAIDKARFKKTVAPGDQMLMEVKLLRRRRDIWRFSAIATVDGDVVCTAELTCAKRHEENN